MFNIKSLSLGLLAGLFALNTVAWAAPKLELVSQVSLVENNAVAVQGNYAYTGDGKTLKIFDVSDPKNPTVVGTSAPMPDNSMEIVIKGNYAYVANARGGLRVLDISNPQHPFEVGVYNTNQPNDGNDWTLWGVDVRDNYAYVADMSSGLRIVDISNPAKPVEVSFVASHSLTHAVKLNGNFAYMVDWGGGLRIVDITNPKSPKEVSFVATRGITYGIAFSNDGKLAYIADYNGLRIVDISNPLSPKDISFYSTPGIAINVVADGNYVYMNSYSELKVLDVSNPQSPLQVDSYNAPENGSGYGLATRFKLNNGFLYAPNKNGGLLILSTGMTTCVDTNGSTQTGIDLVKATPANYGLFTQAQIDAAKLAGIQSCKDNPASCGLFSQTQYNAAKQVGIDLVKAKPNDYGITIKSLGGFTQDELNTAKTTSIQDGINQCKTNPNSFGLFTQAQLDAAKQTGIDLVKAKPNDYNLFSATDVSNKETIAKQTGVQEGINKCKTNPVSCGIVVSNDQCKTNPSSCGLFTQDQLNAEKETAKQNGIEFCKNDPNCKGIHATYNPLNGEVHIPFIDVPNGIGFTQTFDVYLMQRNGSFTFDLDLNRIVIVH